MFKKYITFMLIGIIFCVGLFILAIGGLFFVTQFLGNTDAPSGIKQEELPDQTNAPELVYEVATIELSGEKIVVDLANTPQLRRQGLSDRPSLDPGTGMLFEFDSNASHTFWMKNMHFPIDIIWFDENRAVVYFVESVPPDGEFPQKLYTPQTPARFVLEVPAGWVRLHGVQAGDVFEWCSETKCAEAASAAEETPEEEKEDSLKLKEKLPVLPSTEEVVVELPSFVDIKVPFAAQAPFGNWNDPRQQDGCEEASLLMASLWIRGESLTKQQALDIILETSAWEVEEYGFYEDTSAVATAQLAQDYFGIEDIEVFDEVSVDAIKKALSRGAIVITPMNGQALHNPYFTPPGPERHMVLIRGYDDETLEFITNDPGTRQGEGYRYAYDVFLNAVRDYPSGKDVLFEGDETKAMIVVQK